jgi:adenine-specific DNA-methyltransferase
VARIHDLIRQLADESPDLAREIEREIDVLSERRAFGLNFERHTPEEVELPNRPVRRGDKVHILPPRAETPKAANAVMWVVEETDRAVGTATVARVDPKGTVETRDVDLVDLVVVAEFRDPIYPGLESTGAVECGGDKPYHSVINGENFHALQTLLFTHRGKVDAIYIDPPYNTGARDWKYNNDYVESDDQYRHSKWLAFMERRLLLAKELLNPENSVLIVTIDEKEVHRLALLLEQVFPEAARQLVSIVINPSGTSRDLLSRVEEHAIFLFLGEAGPARVPDNLLTESESLVDAPLPWESLLRRGNTWYRASRPNLCYPVLVRRLTHEIVGVGSPFSGTDEGTRTTQDGDLDYAWPVRTDGRLGIWRKDGAGLMDLVRRGYAYASSPAPTVVPGRSST